MCGNRDTEEKADRGGRSEVIYSHGRKIRVGIILDARKTLAGSGGCL